MDADPDAPRAALAASDLWNTACGVGNMLGALLDQLPGFQPAVIDTAAPWGELRRAARAAAARTDVVVAVYPTLSTTRRWWALARLAALRWWFRHGEVRLYLHEFGRLGRKHRAWITAGLVLTDGRIIVCVPSEARAVQGALAGLAVRGQEVVAVPAVNGTAPDRVAVDESIRTAAAAGEAGARTVGVFGTYRPDKGPEWLDRVLRELDPRFDRVELAGSGWDRCRLSDDVLRRYEVDHLGHVPTADLPGMFGRWGLALAPFWEGGTHDGRTSLRTPLAFGVPTVTRPPRPGDLSLSVAHLRFDDPRTLAAIPRADPHDRRAGAEAVAAYEADVVQRTARALFDLEP